MPDALTSRTGSLTPSALAPFMRPVHPKANICELMACVDGAKSGKESGFLSTAKRREDPGNPLMSFHTYTQVALKFLCI